MQQLIEVAPSSFNYAAETVALWSPGWPTPLRRAGGVVSERLLRSDWRKACVDGQERKSRKTGEGGARRNGTKVETFTASTELWDVLELMFCLRKSAVSILFWRIFLWLGHKRLSNHEWSSSLRMKSRTEQAAAVLWGTGPCPPFCRRLIPAHLGRLAFTGGTGDTMAEHESPEFGKADFVLLDSVSMQEFMANLKLRWAFYLHPD